MIKAHLDGTLATDDVIVCGNVTGAIRCGDIVNDITILNNLTSTGSITANDVTGKITIINGRLNGI